jgi:hypothetical protein
MSPQGIQKYGKYMEKIHRRHRPCPPFALLQEKLLFQIITSAGREGKAKHEKTRTGWLGERKVSRVFPFSLLTGYGKGGKM